MAKTQSKSLGNVILWLTADGKKLDQALERADKAVTAWAKRASASLKTMGSDFQDLGAGVTKLGAVGAAGFAALGGALYKCVEAYAESEKADKQLETVLKSTKGAAGVTKEMVDKLATSFQQLTPFEDDAVKASAAVMLQFTSIGKDVFPQAMQATADLSAKLGTDLNQSAMLVGKALQNPAEGLGKLKRAGISFTDAQEKMIQKFVEMGDTASAQKAVLEGFSTAVGGQAAALLETTGGRLDQLKNMWGDALETIGGVVADLLKPIGENLQGLLDGFKGWLENGGAETIKTTLTQLVTSVGQVVSTLWEMTAPLREWLARTLTENPQRIAQILAIGAAITGLSLALGPVLMGFGSLLQMLGGLITFGSSAFSAMAKGLTWLATQLATSVAWVLGGIAAVAALGVAVAAFAQMMGSGNWTKNFLTDLIDQYVPSAGKAIDWFFDQVVAVVNRIGDVFGWLWDGLKSGFTTVGSLVADVFKMAINSVIEAMNVVILGINTVSGTVGIPEIPEIPTFAGGGVMQRAGLALVGERGPELVRLPAQARVYSNAQSKAMASGLGGGVTVNVSSLVVREEADVERVARALSREIRRGMVARGALV